MKLTALLIVFILNLASFPLMAGSGHDHGHSHAPVTEEKASSNATKIVATLANKKTIDTSWVTIKASSVDKVTVQGNSEWKIVFVNKNISDLKKQTLYVFLTLSGDYIAANFTGK
jgi:hypothetical protein